MAKKGGHSAASFCRSVLPSTLVRWVKFFVILPRRLKILRLKSKNISRQRVVSRFPTTECSLKRSDSCLSRNKRKKRVCAKLKQFILKLVHTMSSRLWRSGASWIWSTAEPFSVQKGSMRKAGEIHFLRQHTYCLHAISATARLGHKGLFETLALSPKKALKA